MDEIQIRKEAFNAGVKAERDAIKVYLQDQVELLESERGYWIAENILDDIKRRDEKDQFPLTEYPEALCSSINP